MAFKQLKMLQMSDMKTVDERFPFPQGTVLALPEEGDVVTGNFLQFFLISLHALEASFCLLMHPLGVGLYRRMRVNPGQLHPNTWWYITAHILRSREVGLDVSIDYFSAGFES